jgi:hypothetical protein
MVNRSCELSKWMQNNHNNNTIHLHCLVHLKTRINQQNGATVVKKFVSVNVPSTVPFHRSVQRSHSEDQNPTPFQRFQTKLACVCRHFPWLGTVYSLDILFLVVRGSDRTKVGRFPWLRGSSRSVKVMHLFCGRSTKTFGSVISWMRVTRTRHRGCVSSSAPVTHPNKTCSCFSTTVVYITEPSKIFPSGRNSWSGTMTSTRSTSACPMTFVTCHPIPWKASRPRWKYRKLPTSTDHLPVIRDQHQHHHQHTLNTRHLQHLTYRTVKSYPRPHHTVVEE